MTRGKIDAKIGQAAEHADAADNRAQASNDRIDFNLALLSAKVDVLPNIKSMIYIIAGFTGFGILAIIFALAYAGDSFDGGVLVSSMNVQQAVEAKKLAEDAAKRAEENARTNRATDEKFKSLIKLIGKIDSRLENIENQK